MLKIAKLIFLGLMFAPMASAETRTYTLPGDKPFYDEWGFSGAVRHGDTLYLSGVVASLYKDETDPAAAYERAFAHIAKTLSLAGAEWGDVVEMTTYHTDLPNQIDGFRKVKDRYVKAPFPAWTAIGVTRLVPPKGLVEIKVIARLKAKKSGPSKSRR